MIKRHKKGAIVLALLVVVLTVVPGCSSNASVDEWTEMYPYWEGLHAVWGSSSSDVFAVGTNGAIVHYNGSTWSPMSITTSHHLFGVWGSSASDVFAVGSGGTILHYDGSAWSVMNSGTKWSLQDIWGSSQTDVYAVGYYSEWDESNGSVYWSTILHYDGENWTEKDNIWPYPHGIWGTSPCDVFAVGCSGGGFNALLHYDGVNWSWSEAISASYDVDFFDIWGSSPSDVFAVGRSGNIVHYDGSEVKSMMSCTYNLLNGIWGSSHSDVYAVGYYGTILHYNGKKWSTMSTDTTWGNLTTYGRPTLNGVWGNSPSDVFVVGDTEYGGTILHFAERQ